MRILAALRAYFWFGRPLLFSSRLRRLALPSQATQAEATFTRRSRSASVRGGEEKALASPLTTSPRSSGGIDEVPPSRRKVQIGAGRRHGEWACRKFGGIALEEIVDIGPAAQKDAAQD